MTKDIKKEGRKEGWRQGGVREEGSPKGMKEFRKGLKELRKEGKKGRKRGMRKKLAKEKRHGSRN